MVHAYNPNAQAGDFQLEVSLGYTARPHLPKNHLSTALFVYLGIHSNY